MSPPAVVIHEEDSMKEIMSKFDNTDEAQLPVVDIESNLLGYISRVRMYAMYRKIISDMSSE